jgi:hypothetical protein
MMTILSWETLRHKEFDEMMQALAQYKKDHLARLKDLEQEYKDLLLMAEITLMVLDAALADPDLSPDKHILYSHERERLDMFIQGFLKEE